MGVGVWVGVDVCGCAFSDFCEILCLLTNMVLGEEEEVSCLERCPYSGGIWGGRKCPD